MTSSVAMLAVGIAPTITNQPQPFIVTNGYSASFVVAAGGWPSLAYQWQFNGTNLDGATNTTLTLQNAFPANAGLYSVAITNTCGSITSNPALLTILPLGLTIAINNNIGRLSRQKGLGWRRVLTAAQRCSMGLRSGE